VLFSPGQDATYHLVKNAADDRVLLREKAKYILSHFLGVLETKTTPQFNPKAHLQPPPHESHLSTG
jgi:hypothetical protein